LFDSSNSFSKYPKNLENFTESMESSVSLNDQQRSNKTIFENLE
jgi:hypothetical protein